MHPENVLPHNAAAVETVPDESDSAMPEKCHATVRRSLEGPMHDCLLLPNLERVSPPDQQHSANANDEDDTDTEDAAPGAMTVDQVQADNSDDERKEPLPLVEPDYTKANQIKFADLCKRFETLWKHRAARSNKRSKDEKLEYLLPGKLFRFLEGGSPYPILRLIAPTMDSSRPSTGVRESGIAKAWGSALGLNKDSRAYLKLVNFTDPTIAGATAAGDLSVAIKEVLEERIPSKPSSVSVGEVNTFLDELQNIKKFDVDNLDSPRSHDWRNMENGAKKNKKGANKHRLRALWVEKLIAKDLSPLEHKWIVRILIQKVEISLGDHTILKYYSKYAIDLWNSNNSLKRLCTTLSDPNWLRRRQEMEEVDKINIDKDRRRSHMPQSTAVPTLGGVLSPMLAKRTLFQSALTDMTRRHRNFVKSQSKEKSGELSLALRFPTFICEVKLDGERIVAHIERGIVKMQTRNSNWYSQSYSPVLGPPLRQAIAKYDVDVIFDGEVVSWDEGRKETIPFGTNRTVAAMRREWCRRHGMIDVRDTNLQNDEDDANVVRASVGVDQNSVARLPTLNPGEGSEPGSECWLNYIIFDILYVGGPGAHDLVSKSISPSEKTVTGSIVNLPAFERKKILYKLIEQQEHQVEIVPSMVIRSNGLTCDAASYFSPSHPASEFGFPLSTLDSIECALRGDIPNLADIEKKLVSGRSYAEINQRRADAMEGFYNEIVELKCLEGLVFKDLVSPYILGGASREYGYWCKLKADYHEIGQATDIDVIVLGAYYASGMSKAGLLNSFLVGCVDNENPGKHMVLCKVSGGGTSRKELQRLLDYTAYNKDSAQDGSFGKWTKEANHGRSLPDFISPRSFQRSRKGDNDGWKFTRDKYPDLWINPKDSVVLQLNAAEITISDGYSAGVTLRFPRITKVRIGEGAKPANQVESIETLHDLYINRMNQTTEASAEFHSRSPSKQKGNGGSRFLTEEENKQEKRKPISRSRASADISGWKIPVVDEVKTRALGELNFTVLEGTYILGEKTLDAEEARGQGWYEEANIVSCREDVMHFIMKHGGRCKLTGATDTDFILGGRDNDARVVNFYRALIAASDDKRLSKRKSDLPLRKIVQMGGVLKWTFVFSLVKRWENLIRKSPTQNAVGNDHSESEAKSIATFSPDLLQPGRHDFLILSKAAEIALVQYEDSFGLPVNTSISMVDLKRSLQHVRKRKRKEEEKPATDETKGESTRCSNESNKSISGSIPWQYSALESLLPEERWVVAGDQQHLWPYRVSGDTKSKPEGEHIVIYPDLFGNSFGLLDRQEAAKDILSGRKCSRWSDISPELELSAISATLPLARIMGAHVTPYLHAGVTHILCNLRSHDSLVWRIGLGLDVFPRKEMNKRLQSFRDEDFSRGDEKRRVTLITPKWIQDAWSNSEQG